jgi:outer membrane protein TolC
MTQSAFAEKRERKKADTLSLPMALRALVQRDPALLRAKIDVEVVEAALKSASSIEDYVVTANASYLRNRAEAVAGNVTGTNKLDRLSADASVTKRLPTGGEVSLGANMQRAETEFSLSGAENIQYQTGIAFSLNHPLLRGLGPTVATSEREIARAGKDAAYLEGEVVAREAIRDLLQAYWELAFAIRDREIREGALELAHKQLKNTQAQVDLGRVAATEAAAVEQIIATREEEILQSELTVTQRSLELRRRLGLAIAPGSIDLQTTAPIAPAPKQYDLSALMKNALASAPEVLALRARERGAQIDVEVTENGLLPRLDLTLSGGPLGIGPDQNTATESLFDLDGYQVQANLAFEYAIGASVASGAHRRARAERRRIKVDLRDMEAQVASAVAQTARAAATAEERIALSQKVIELAERNVVAEQRRFELGRSTNFDVLQRQDELKQAQLRLVRASVDYLNAQAAMDALTGEILTRYGIKL